MMFFMTGMNDIWHALEVPCDPAGLDGALENVRNWFPDDDQFGDCLRNEKRPSCDPRLGTELPLGLLHYACGSALAPAPDDEQERRAACVARLLAVRAGFVDGAATHVTRTEDGFASRGGLTPLHVWASTLGEHSLPVLRRLGGRRVQARRHAFMVPGWPRFLQCTPACAVCNVGLTDVQPPAARRLSAAAATVHLDFAPGDARVLTCVLRDAPSGDR